MNFFERQHAARRATSRLIGLFVLAVLAIVIAVDLAVLAVVGSRTADPQALTVALVVATVLTLGLIGLGSLYRVAMLSGGGGDSIALQLGGVPVPERSDDLQYKRLRNVVEEMAIASGVPMPRLFVLEHEAGINAFAAGWSPSDAAIGVTRGALERLNRDELQAVVAHEFSHILNGDMRLNLRLIGVLFGILMLALVGRKILEHGRYTDRDKGAAAVLVLALAAMLIGYIGLFFGRMIKAGVSRSREFLADASAVQFTRQSVGLAGALKKIGGLSAGSRLNHAGDAEEISHMLFGDGVGFDGMTLGDWFATHPPLVERIRALDPAFRAEHLPRLRERWSVQPPVGIEEDVRLGLAPVDALPSPTAELRVAPAKVAAQVAKPAADDYRRADAIVAGLPETVRALAASRDDAIPLILGLLLDAHPRVQARQHEDIVARLGRPIAELALLMRQQHLQALHPMLRLPLASLTFPVLRQRPRPELGALLDTVHAVAHSDGSISAFEYCLASLLETQLRESLAPGRHTQFGRRKLSDTRREAAMLLALVAQAGHDDEASARRAYNAGLQRILPHGHIDYAPPAEGMPALDTVWPLLDALDPLAKGQLVEAVAAAIGHDGDMRVVEAELLRTVCGVLHCPLPPMLERG